MEGQKLAVLIDADNAQASISEELLVEVSRYGVATVRRAYGDWTKQNLSGWKQVLLDLAIQPVQQFSYTTGKNATDSALIIDAMDLLHTGDVNGFCIVSSDSDFTRLATRLREAGHTVYGFGEQKTPKPFVAACDKFIYTEILRPEPSTPAQTTKSQPKLKKLLLTAVDGAAREDGWAVLAAVGSLLMQADPSFDARVYGHKKLGDLVKSQNYLEVKAHATSEGAPTQQVFVRRSKT
ncbi:NYN domain-containing protein [Solilutibacter silvestris]|uniref:NYN domain-containing protein n=1 Tax=Solilutibacter silvestris TaxID=1645665 RepID=A0A2K1Q3X0_9GAMM|nr:NYN domain-containing protein [Lysobacter silvestris]PNS09752.1 NYN domain-containing protein [Lysobacter silvestris]